MGSDEFGARSGGWLGGVALALLAQATLAHHGFTNHFDPERETTISGTVTAFRFVNPHVMVFIDVEIDGEIEHWKVESGGTSGFLANGRMSGDSLKQGDPVEVVGHPSRHNDFEMRANWLLLPDGRELTMRNPYETVPFLQKREEN